MENNSPDNRVDKIKFNRYAFVKISREVFEYHYGVNEYSFIIPIKNIKSIRISRKVHYENNVGCNLLGMLLELVLALLSSRNPIYNESPTIHDNEARIKNAEVIIRYKDDGETKTKTQKISWPGLSNMKAEKIIRIVKMRNKNLA